MNESLVVQGRKLTGKDLDLIEELVRSHPSWHRTRLSRELCKIWDWCDAAGRIKDMACRTMLLKLQRKGLIELPPQRRSGVNHLRGRSFQPILHDTSPIHCKLSELNGVRLCIADSGYEADLLKTLLQSYHYLGFTTKVGKNISYLALDTQDRPVGVLLFGAAAWKTLPRDQFIGWTPDQRSSNLELITNNMRFLIPPWVCVPHLASHILALAARQICDDWNRKYAHPVVLLETFVQLDRFRGTCYKAANWKYLGETTGRTRNDVHTRIQTPIKAVFAYPLRRNFRQHLTNQE
ncbi:MAG: hypothetical protein B6244_14680 [Candidatus Cloacimonetes bacterium 4572_55]|nr:MAG: hypothetical protein B6244_14680 [Candidatus Cloacimonetes bacterium 4572_55]